LALIAAPAMRPRRCGPGDAAPAMRLGRCGPGDAARAMRLGRWGADRRLRRCLSARLHLPGFLYRFVIVVVAVVAVQLLAVSAACSVPDSPGIGETNISNARYQTNTTQSKIIDCSRMI